MRNLIYLSIFFIIFLCTSLSYGTGISGLPDGPHLVSRGSALLKVEPDTLTMKLAITDTGTDVTEVRANVEKRSIQLIEKLVSAGISRNDITAAELRVIPHFNWSGRQQIYTGTEVSRQATIVLRDLGLYDTLMDSVTGAGIARIQNTRLSTSREKVLQDKLLQMAVDDAQHKANVLAQQFGRKLGPVYSASPVSAGAPLMRESYSVADSGRSSGFEPGTLSLTYTLQVIYLLTDK